MRGGTPLAGRVIRLSSRHAVVTSGDRSYRCTLRKGLFLEETTFRSPIAVGDRVNILASDDTTGVVTEILPRRGYLSRWHKATGKEQVMIANLDQVLVAVSFAEPAFRPRLVDRILVAAGRGRFDAAIVFTKVDLVPDRETYLPIVEMYRNLG